MTMMTQRTKSPWALLALAYIVLSAGAVRGHDGPDDETTTGNEPAPTTDVAYESPKVDARKFYFAEHFDNPQVVDRRWVKSRAKKEDVAEDVAKYDGEWSVELPQRTILDKDLGLVLKSKAKHAAIAAALERPFVFNNRPLVVQYEVNLQDGQECGGSYIKLLSQGKETGDLSQFRDKTPYTIMFGPDKCGNDVKLHFIFRHVNPLNGTITEKHCNKQKERLDDPFKDKRPHLYQLVIYPDNTFIIRYDRKVVNEGSLLTNFTPAVNPPKEIDDPTDTKPENWDDREKIADPDATKPDDWNEDEPGQIPDPKATKPAGWLDDVEEMIPDEEAVKPDDWDIEMDGEWEPPLVPNPMCEKAVGCGLWKAPMVPNPNYKGKWRAPLIVNVNYQGKWAPAKIPNPDYFEDLNPYKMTPISAVGFEIWSMSSDILFDNVIITDDEDAANEWAAQTFDLKLQVLDKQAKTLWDRVMKYLNYKPEYFVAYFTYCSIPMIAYIWFLLTRRDKKETFVSRIMQYANEKPWLWAVLVVVVGLFVAMLMYCLCVTKDNKTAAAARSKKTDEYTAPDSKPEQAGNEEEEEDEEDDDGGANRDDHQTTTVAGGDDNEEDEEEEQQSEEEEEDEEDDEGVATVEDAEEAQPQRGQTNENEGLKKRKSRKD